MVIDTFVIDEVVEELVHGLGCGLRYHMAGSFDSDHCEIIGVELVEAGMLVTHVPRIPFPYLRPTHLLHVELSISEGHNVVPVAAEKPDLDCSVIKDPLVFGHRASFGNGIGDIGADFPGLVHFIDFIWDLIEIPISNDSIVRRTVGDFSQDAVLFLRDDALGEDGLFGGEGFFQSEGLRGGVFAGLIDIWIGVDILYWLI